MKVLSEIANSLDVHIQTTFNCPSLNTLGRMPVLDLSIWVEGSTVHHTFFKKPMASPYMIMYSSALASKTKRQALVQEGLRRLRNMGPGVSQEENLSVMSRLMHSMMMSGYDHKFRLDILKGIQNEQLRIDREIQDGTRKQYRSREEILEQKSRCLGKHPNTWFLRGKVQNTLKVPVTPDSELIDNLKRVLEDEIGAEGGTTKCVELGGDLVTKGLSGSVKPTGPRSCVFQEECNADEGVGCTVQRLVYQVSCKNCSEGDPPTESIYVGTSGYSLHRRQRQHMEEIRRNQQSNAMAKHQRHVHPTLQPNFRSKPIRGGMQYNLDRYILEAHLIQENSQKDDVVLMNQRSEFGNRGIPRIETRTNLL